MTPPPTVAASLRRRSAKTSGLSLANAAKLGVVAAADRNDLRESSNLNSLSERAGQMASLGALQVAG